jgi:hypothetical protein
LTPNDALNHRSSEGPIPVITPRSSDRVVDDFAFGFASRRMSGPL